MLFRSEEICRRAPSAKKTSLHGFVPAVRCSLTPTCGDKRGWRAARQCWD